jgi:peptidoglycan/LPS O-acetylase OafA/YrhL
MQRYKALDGLRGIAALNVTIAHFICAFSPSVMHYNYPSVFKEGDINSFFYEIISSPFASILYNGEFAVLIFFILSGFVLSKPYFDGEKTKLWQRIYARYFRLNIPIGVSMLVAFAFLNLGLFYNIEASKISGSENWFGYFYSNANVDLFKLSSLVFYEAIFFGDGALNPPLWTLGIEFLGSLLLLLYLAIVPSGKNYFFIPLLVIFIFIAFDQLAIYYLAFFSGALIHKVKISTNLNWVLFALSLVLAGYQYDRGLYEILPEIYYYDDKTFYNAIAAFILRSIVKSGFLGKIFESNVSLFFGKCKFRLNIIIIWAVYNI